jgi:TRAP-type C4-dicarboxylate transport system permease small subunit
VGRLARVAHWLDLALERLAGFLLLAMVVTVGAQVLFRYGLNASLSWPEELSVLFFGWATWLGAATGVHRGAHLRMDVLYARRGEVGRRRLDVAIDLLVLAFLAVLVAKSIPVVQGAEITSYSFLPFSIMVLYVALPVGASLMALFIAVRLVARLRGGAPR